MKTKKTLFGGLFVAIALSATYAIAQDFPNKPIRIVVPYSPGGGTDAVARIMAQRLTATLGQSVLVENKPGASANIGSEFVARAPADGYTILVTAPNFTTSEALYDKLTWRFDDFIPLIHLVRYANVLVAAPDSKMVTLPEMVSRAKAAPGMMTYGSAGTGSNSHLAMELLKQRVGINPEHVPYKGSGPALTDLIGGQVQYCFETMTSATPHVKSGKAIALAQTRTKRAKGHPNVPTMDEQGFGGFDATTWYGLVGPARMNPSFVKRINEDMNRVMAMPDVIEKFDQYGAEDGGGSPERFAEFIRSETQKWAKVIKDAKVQADS